MRVLVVEDDPGLAAVVQRGLEAEGFAVDLSTDGVEAVWRATEQTYDVVVCDLMLPGQSGFTVCAKLREAGVGTPILVLTAKQGEFDEAEALDTGADDFLTKPFSFVVLVARLRALMRRGASARPPVLRCGGVSLDPAARRCTRDGEAISLTPREFALLEFLMRRAGDVVTKQDLLRHVWNVDFEGDPNIVEVYIGYLRRKLGPELIETVRGIGYRVSDGG